MATSKTKKKKQTKVTSKKSQNTESGFQAEIILVVVLAASVILMVSTFGMGGLVGNAISNVIFGIMGYLAYPFPIILFIAVAFAISNTKNKLAHKKIIALIIFFCFLCALCQLLTEDFSRSNSLFDYYSLCSTFKTGGGIIGGAVCMSITTAFGIVGGYIAIGAVLIICLIIITQKSFFGYLSKISTQILGIAKLSHEHYKEGQPERELKKELREKKRNLRKSEKRADRIRRLEEAIAENEEAAARPFLEGTKLTPPQDPFPFNLTPDFFDEEDSAIEPEEEKADIKDDIREKKMESKEERIEFKKEIEFKEESIGLEEEEEISQIEEPAPKTKKINNPRSSQEEIDQGIHNIATEIKKAEEEMPETYQFPPLNLLKRGSGKSQGDSETYLKKTAFKLQETLKNFGVNVTISNVSCGPTVTRYELQPEMGVKVSRIVALADDIKLNLATPDIRIEAPIPGKAAVGIEVPNRENSVVMLRDLLQSDEFANARSKLSFAVGKDIAGMPVVTDIAKMPHLLIAGATGSGKSVCINTLIMSILYKATPEEVKLIMIDPKVVELSVYNGIPHLFIPVVTDPKKAAGALNWAVSEMTNRYNVFAEYGVRNLAEYNKKISGMTFTEEEPKPDKMPQIVIIVDELADLMMVAPGEVEDAICRLAQLARAAGIHLIIATQRPSVNVITGIIKANMPSRIAFAVSSGVDSRTILDMNGAEKLLGKGDMLFSPQGYPKPARLQGAYVSDEEVSSVVNFLSNKNPVVQYNAEIENQVHNVSISSSSGSSGNDRDIYFEEAGKFIIEKERASIGMLQRVFKIGFNRAARIMDQLFEAGVVGPEEGTKPRKVLMSMEEFQSYLESQ